MRRVLLGILAAASIAVLLLAGHRSINAADHLDSPSVAGGPCDIADLYSWMSPDAGRVVMAMTTPAAALSNQCQYVFHVGSASAFGEQLTNTMVVCQYDAEITCWVGEPGETQGGAYQAKVSGATGDTIEGEGIKLYAGSREDPFFFNLQGFSTAVETVRGAAGGLTPNEYGCPNVDAATSAALVEQLSTDGAGGPAADSFAAKNVTAVIVELDKTLVNSGGPVLAIWASTRQR
jgi:hypothetical protein